MKLLGRVLYLEAHNSKLLDSEVVFEIKITGIADRKQMNKIRRKTNGKISVVEVVFERVKGQE